MKAVDLNVFRPDSDEIATHLEVWIMDTERKPAKRRSINDDDPDFDKSAKESVYIVVALILIATALMVYSQCAHEWGWPLVLLG